MNKLNAALLGMSVAGSMSICSAQGSKIPFMQLEHDARVSAKLMVPDSEAAVSRSNEAYSLPPAFSASLYVQPTYKQPRTADSKFFLVNGLHLGWAALDIGMTHHCIANHHCREGNPIMPTSWGPQVAINAVFVSTSALISYHLKKQSSKAWWLSPVIGASAHTAGAITGIINR